MESQIEARIIEEIAAHGGDIRAAFCDALEYRDSLTDHRTKEFKFWDRVVETMSTRYSQM